MRALRLSFLSIVALAAVFSSTVARPCAAQLAATDLGVLPGCTDSLALDINSAGQIVGYCEGDSDSDGVRDVELPIAWQNGTMTALPLPDGFVAGLAVDINGSGQIVGACRRTGTNTYQGCHWNASGSGWTVEALAALAECSDSFADMINDAGQMVVQCRDAHYFRDSQGAMTKLEDADGVLIIPWQMNASGQIVGRVGDGDAVLWSAASPGSVTERIHNVEQRVRVNDHGQVVGTYWDADPGSSSGGYVELNFLFLPEPKEAWGTLHAGLTSWPVGLDGRITGINNAGQMLMVAPQTSGDTTSIQVFHFEQGVSLQGTVPGRVNELSVAINGNGEVAGSAEVSDGITHGFYGSSGTGIVSLEGLGGARSEVMGLNDSGIVFGYSTLADGSTHACTWTTSSPTYSWSDFLQPINQPNDARVSTSAFKAGSTVPVKFALTGPSAGITDLVATFTYAQVSNGVEGTAMEATSTSAATTGNVFRYDAASGQYMFNWSTKRLGKGSYKVIVDMGDGVSRTVIVSLR